MPVVTVGVSTTIEGIQTDTIGASFQSRDGLVCVVGLLVMFGILHRAGYSEFCSFPASSDIIVVKPRVDDVCVGYVNPILLCMAWKRCTYQEEDGV